MNSGPVAPTSSRLIVKRNGKAITGTVPKPMVLIDTREQLPFTFDSFGNWIAGTRRATLPTGDYSVEGMEGLITMERKSLADLIGTLMRHRGRFFAECERMMAFKWRAILVEASYEEIKSPYALVDGMKAHPNGVIGTLDAIEAKFGIPVVFTSTNRALAEEKAASWISKHFTYWWLETNQMGRVLQEGDL